MQVAFYAPMKPPDHPVPSGDRTMARQLIAALARIGHDVLHASPLRSWTAAPDQEALAGLTAAAAAEVARLRRDAEAGRFRPDAWLTYHLYHKAPDLIGPHLARALSIPYVLIEASRAGRRAHDEWHAHFAYAEHALAAADAVVAVTSHDRAGLVGAVPADRLHQLAPFIAADRFDAPRQPAQGPQPDTVRLLAVGMMRPGNKEACYRLLAEALAQLGDRSVSLTIVGDGPCRDRIEPLFPPAHTRFLGEQAAEAMPAIYAAHDLFVWPAINEPYGFVLMEAQAAGLPVVAGAARGVPDIVADRVGGRLTPAGDAAAFAQAVAALIDDADMRRRMGAAARRYVRANHDIAVAAPRLGIILEAAARTADGRCQRAGR